MTATIAVLGDHDSSLLTHRELDAALAALPEGVAARWVATDGEDARRIDAFDAVWVAPGSPYRDDDAVLAAIRHARETGLPLLGTCSGFQAICLELARNVAGLPDAAHAETDPAAPRPLIARLACRLVGEERAVVPVAGTRVAAIVGDAPFAGFHWCRYGVDAGVEALELPGHPFFLATLFQPQVGSTRSGRPPALLTALATAAQSARGHAAPV